MANLMHGSLDDKPGIEEVGLQEMQTTLLALGANQQRTDQYSAVLHTTQGLEYIKTLLSENVL